MKPFGMRGYRVTLGFGKFAGEVIRPVPQVLRHQRRGSDEHRKTA